MFDFDNIHLNFNSDPLVLILGVAILILYTLYMYRITIPPVGRLKKGILVAIRILLLALIFLLIFEPKITFEKKVQDKPLHYLFIDNSSSMVLTDSSGVIEEINDLVGGAETIFGDALKVYSFGSGINGPENDIRNKLRFNETQTNIQRVFDLLADDPGNIASVAIVSDGIITQGTNPVYSAERMGLPVYTIGLGDTSQRRDVEIGGVYFNSYIYEKKTTLIAAAVNNFGFAGSPVEVKFYENNRLLESKSIILDNANTGRVEFDYTPSEEGEKKLTLTVSKLTGEVTHSNNSKTVFVNVLKSRLKILLLTSSLSPDFSFIRNALTKDINHEVLTITQISASSFAESTNFERLIDSCDIMFLIGFPSEVTPEDLLRKVFGSIDAGKPYFLLTSNGTDLGRLIRYNPLLPVELKRDKLINLEIQPVIKEINNPLFLHDAEDPISHWNNLPPVPLISDEFELQAGSSILASAKANNAELDLPVIVSRSRGNLRGIAVLARNIWRWKLSESRKDDLLFDSFIRQSAKWLNSPEDMDRVRIAPSRRIYSLGDEIKFTAQVYDETFTPLENAELKVAVEGNGEKFDLYLNSEGQGIYTGVIEPLNEGDYTFSGTALLGEVRIGADAGRFTVAPVEVEKLNQRADHNLLKLLANVTGGQFFRLGEDGSMFQSIAAGSPGRIKSSVKTTEFSVWSNEIILIVLIFFFGLEWFLRKQSGML